LTALPEVFYLAVAEVPHNVRVVVDPEKKLNNLKYILKIILYCCDRECFFLNLSTFAFRKIR